MSPTSKELYIDYVKAVTEELASDQAWKDALDEFNQKPADLEKLQRLQDLANLRSTLSSTSTIKDPVTAALESLDKEKIDLPLRIERTSPDKKPKAVVKTFIEDTKTKEPRFWMENASAIILQRLIEKKDGEFVYNDITEAGIGAVDTHFRNLLTIKEKRKVNQRVFTDRNNFANTLKKIGNYPKHRTMSDILINSLSERKPGYKGQPVLDRGKSPEYNNLYKLIVQHHGDLTLYKFINEVLYRKFEKPEQKKQKPKKEIQKKRDSGITPKDVMQNPVTEIILCNNYTNKSVLQKISEEVLDNNELFDWAVSHGWKPKGDPREELDMSCAKKANERNYAEIPSKEGVKALNLIIKAVKSVTGKYGRSGWYKVRDFGEGWNLTYTILGAIRKDQCKIDKFINILSLSYKENEKVK
ncbi:hypothetical protein ACFL1Q_02755 [Patescibacteria group bacterium]